MKSNLFYLVVSVLFAGFLTLGFQCGSPDFTGAKVQEQNKNYVEAVKLYEREVQKNPANHEAWFRLGRLRGEQLGDYKGMMDAFQEAEKLSPTYTLEIRAWRYKFWAQHINNGVSFVKRAGTDSVQFFDDAIKEYNTAASIWPDTAITYLYLAAAYKGKGDYDNLILSQKKAWNYGRDKEQYKQVGKYLVSKGLEKKDQFKTENADKLKLQKNMNETDKGSYKSDVMRSFGAPDNQKKDKKNPKREDWVYNQYGMTLTIENEKVVAKKINKPYDYKIDSTKYYEAVEEFNKAVDVFEEIKALNPKDNENLNLLLQAYYEAGRVKEATVTFKLAVDNDPGNKMNHYILGLLYRTVEDYDGAIAEFKKAVEIDPSFSDAIFDIGATLYNWGVKMKKAAQEKGDESNEFKSKFKEALPWIEKVVELKTAKGQDAASKSGKDWHAELTSEDARIWDTVGTIYALLGQTEKAMKALDDADQIRKAGK